MTHGIRHLHDMENILVMSQGAIAERGSQKQLMECGGAFSQFLEEYKTKWEHKEEAANAEEYLEITKEAKGKDLIQTILDVSRDSIVICSRQGWQNH